MSIPNFALPVGDGYRFISAEDILYCKSEGSRTHITLTNSEVVTVNKKLKDVMIKLDNDIFVRIHNSHMINITCAVRYFSRNKEIVILTNGDGLKVSRNRKKDFLDRFTRL